ncbi:MAG: FliH/SctL family protein [Thermodesulfobacteriota bacterium]
MSKIFEFKEKIEKERRPDFISFESMMPGRGKEDPADPLQQLKNEQEAVRRETEAMVARAEAEKKRIEEEAYRKGFARGEAEGLKAGEKAFTEKMKEAARLISSLENERDLVHRRYEKELLSLIKVMVERLVGHEVSVNHLVIVDCLQRAMKYVVEDSTVKVHLQSDDLQYIKEISLEDPSLLQGARRIELIEDPVVARGGCLLQTDFGEIDATLDNCRERLFAIVERAFLEALAADGKE